MKFYCPSRRVRAAYQLYCGRLEELDRFEIIERRERPEGLSAQKNQVGSISSFRKGSLSDPHLSEQLGIFRLPSLQVIRKTALRFSLNGFRLVCVPFISSVRKNREPHFPGSRESVHYLPARSPDFVYILIPIRSRVFPAAVFPASLLPIKKFGTVRSATLPFTMLIAPAPGRKRPRLGYILPLHSQHSHGLCFFLFFLKFCLQRPKGSSFISNVVSARRVLPVIFFTRQSNCLFPGCSFSIANWRSFSFTLSLRIVFWPDIPNSALTSSGLLNRFDSYFWV